MTVTYIDSNGSLKTKRIPKNATRTNGPLLPLWNQYDANGTGFDMFQDSWGRRV